MDYEKVDALIKHVPLFNGLERDEVVKIFAKGMTMRCAKGETLFYKGNIGNQMYIVLGGKIGIYDGQKVLSVLRVGEMFGEMALVTREARSATARAMEDSKLFVLSEETFERLLTKRVAIRILLNIIGTLAHRLKDANAQIKTD
jgi:CRP/FNR family transcriptional regulator